MAKEIASTVLGLCLQAPLNSTQDSKPTLSVETATVLQVGVVKPDGTTITITADGTISAAGGGGGTVTAVTASAPLASSGGTTPNITAAAATVGTLGVVQPDGTTITISAGTISANFAGLVTSVTATAPLASSGGTTPNLTVTTATVGTRGVVQPDGTTITISGATISVPTATTGNLGLVAPDGTTIKIAAGVISTVNPIAAVDLTGQTAAITNHALFTPSSTGFFRVSMYAKVTTPASTSSVLNGSTGFVVNYTDGTDSVAQTPIAPTFTQFSILISASGNANNNTATIAQGNIVFFAKVGIAVTFSYGYTSVGGTPMAYELHVRAEAL